MQFCIYFFVFLLNAFCRSAFPRSNIYRLRSSLLTMSNIKPGALLRVMYLFKSDCGAVRFLYLFKSDCGAVIHLRGLIFSSYSILYFYFPKTQI